MFNGQAGQRILWAIAALAAYVALGVASLQVATIHISSSPVWLPAGFAIGLLALFGTRYWPLVLVGALTVNVTTSGDWLTSTAIAGGNTLEAVSAAWLIRRLNWNEPLSKLSHMGWLSAAVTVGSAISATVGVTTLVLAGTPWSAYANIWITWFLGNLGGSLVVVPLMVLAHKPNLQDAQALLTGFAAATLAFVWTPWLLWVLMPAIAWLTVQARRAGTAWGILGMATAAVTLTLLGRGPFGSIGSNEALLLLQLFLIALSVTTLVLSAGVHQRERGPSAQRWSGTSLAGAPLIVSAMFTGLLLHPALLSLDEERRTDAGEHFIEQWEQAIMDQEARLRALQSLYAASGDVSRQQFDTFVTSQDWPFGPGGITAVGFARAVEKSDLSSYEQSVRSDAALPEPVRSSFGVFPPPDGDSVPVDHVYPMDPKPGAIGFDLLADPDRKAVLATGAESGDIVATEPVEIVKPNGNETGFFLALAVELDGELLGYVVLVQTVDDASLTVDPRTSEFSITDVTDPTNPNRLLASMEDLQPDQIHTMEVGGRQWEIAIQTASTVSGAGTQSAWFVLASGGAMSVAVAATVYAHDSTRARARAMSRSLIDQAKLDAERVGEIQRLQDRDEFRKSFLNLVAHELRTPLTPIKTQAFLLRANASEDDVRAHELLQRGVDRLTNVVDDLLIAARLDAKGMVLTLEQTDVLDVVRDSLESFEDTARRQGTHLSMDGPSVQVRGDPQRLAQVVDNLVSNAIKFAKGGSVKASIHPDGAFVELRIQDDGIGIDPSKLGELGQPFVQAHDVSKTQVSGTGLGLYICRSIANLHGGELTVHSEGLGHGATSVLRIPVDGPLDAVDGEQQRSASELED